MIRAVLFDFDGVIVDSEGEKFRIVAELLEPYDIRLSDEDYPGFIGMKTRAFLARFSSLDEDVVSEIERAWRARRSVPVPFPQIERVFSCLRQRGVRIGIVTGSSRGTVLASGVGSVDVLVCGDEAPSKPAPDGYEIAVSKLDLRPDDVLVVEDSAAGVESARRAGLRVVSLRTPGLVSERHFRTHTELETFLCRTEPIREAYDG